MLRSLPFAMIVLLIASSRGSAQIAAPYDRPAGGFGPGFGSSFSPGFVGPYGAYGPGRYGYNPFFGGYSGYPLFLYPLQSRAPFARQAPAPFVPNFEPQLPLPPINFAALSSAVARREAMAKNAKSDARLTLTLPAAAEVWLNGTKQTSDSANEFILRIGDLTPGDTTTMKIRATWTQDDQTLEFETTLEMDAGATKSLLVAAGTPIGK